MNSNPFTDKDRKTWNAYLRDLTALSEDVERALRIGVPGSDMVRDSCQGCIEGFTRLKKEFFPNKP